MGLHLDELARAISDPRTPRDEVRDINSLLFRDYVSTLRHPDPEELRHEVGQLMANQAFMAKGMRLQQYQIPYAVDPEVTGRGHDAILQINEYGVVGNIGPDSRYVEKPLAGGFGLIRDAINNVEIIRAIILTLQRFVLQFCQPEREHEPEGFKFVRKDGEKLNPDDEKETLRLEEWVLNSGDESDARRRKKMGRHDMQGFVTALTNDSFGADACPVETERKNNGKISGLYNMPFDAVRLCTEEGYEGNDEICAVQVIHDSPWVAFGYDDIVYEIRNRRTDMWVNGYGASETEMLIRFWTAFINSFNYNAAGLDRNSIPRGLLALYGEYDQRQLMQFTRSLEAMLHGAMNRWTAPVIAAKGKGQGGAEWIKIDENFNEMYFAKWFSFLVSIPCAFWGIDPTEINIDGFSSKQQSSLSGKDTGDKFARSRDKGLIPALRFVKRWYNSWIIPELTKKYRLEFTGLNEEDAETKKERINLTSTVDEMREIDGRSPHKDPVMGGAPTNAALMQLYMAQQGAQQGQDGQDAQGGGQVDQDYPTDDNGEHQPYGDDEEPGENDFHTLQLGDDDKPVAKAVSAPKPRGPSTHVEPVRRGPSGPVKVKRQVGDFLVVVERR